jgi:hypothetical protein
MGLNPAFSATCSVTATVSTLLAGTTRVESTAPSGVGSPANTPWGNPGSPSGGIEELEVPPRAARAAAPPPNINNCRKKRRELRELIRLTSATPAKVKGSATMASCL